MPENDRLIEVAKLQLEKNIREALTNNREGVFGAKVSIRCRKGIPEITTVIGILEPQIKRAA